MSAPDNGNPAGESCGECVFFKAISILEGGQPGAGFCRRFPPRGYPVGTGPGGQVGAIPVPTPTSAGNWCGEFLPLDEYVEATADPPTTQ